MLYPQLIISFCIEEGWLERGNGWWVGGMVEGWGLSQNDKLHLFRTEILYSRASSQLSSIKVYTVPQLYQDIYLSSIKVYTVPQLYQDIPVYLSSVKVYTVPQDIYISAVSRYIVK